MFLGGIKPSWRPNHESSRSKASRPARITNTCAEKGGLYLVGGLTVESKHALMCNRASWPSRFAQSSETWRVYAHLNSSIGTLGTVLAKYCTCREECVINTGIRQAWLCCASSTVC